MDPLGMNSDHRVFPLIVAVACYVDEVDIPLSADQ